MKNLIIQSFSSTGTFQKASIPQGDVFRALVAKLQFQIVYAVFFDIPGKLVILRNTNRVVFLISCIAATGVDAGKKSLTALWMRNRINTQIHPNADAEAPAAKDHSLSLTDKAEDSKSASRTSSLLPAPQHQKLKDPEDTNPPTNVANASSSRSSSLLALVATPPIPPPPDTVKHMPAAGEEFEIKLITHQVKQSMAHMMGYAKKHTSKFSLGSLSTIQNSNSQIHGSKDSVGGLKRHEGVDKKEDIMDARDSAKLQVQSDKEAFSTQKSITSSRVNFLMSSKTTSAKDAGGSSLEEVSGSSRNPISFMNQMKKTLKINTESADSLVIHKLNEGLDHYENFQKKQVSGMLQRAITTTSWNLRKVQEKVTLELRRKVLTDWMSQYVAESRLGNTRKTEIH
ncbi:hypothetical protein HDV05_007506 [Chytridiales sp. JEL 0842]|nr:hypothetical protein HDV05_007506 [Chytridiales sp. JEL 0842]